MFRKERAGSLREKDLEEDSMGHVLKLGFSSGLVQDQARRLRRAREFVAKNHKKELEEPHEEEVKEKTKQEQSEGDVSADGTE